MEDTVRICVTSNLVPTIIATVLATYLMIIGIEWVASKFNKNDNTTKS
jgi:predicted thioesterase